MYILIYLASIRSCAVGKISYFQERSKRLYKVISNIAGQGGSLLAIPGACPRPPEPRRGPGVPQGRAAPGRGAARHRAHHQHPGQAHQARLRAVNKRCL